MVFVTEKERKTPQSDSCDVLVAGGGIAGIAAALAAARTSRRLKTNKKVLLIERECLLGGLATLGLVTIYLPLCDGNGRQVSFGIAEELLRLGVKHGAEARYPDAWLDGDDEERLIKRKTQRFQVQYNPHLYALEAEKLLLEAGVQILYHTQICDAICDNGRISHVIIENKNGRSAVAVGSVIDCTGDADICKLSGEATALFAQGNVVAAWHYYESKGKTALKILGASDIPDKQKTGKEAKPLVARRFDGITDISDMLLISHEKMLEHILAKREGDSSYLPSTTPTIPQIRMTRRIVGRYTLDDTEMHTHFDDSVGVFSDWRKAGPVYELPFRTLLGDTVQNLLVSGRCISVTDAMWDITRVIPVCAVSGEATGTAAAMTDNFHTISVPDLQNELLLAGANLKL